MYYYEDNGLIIIDSPSFRRNVDLSPEEQEKYRKVLKKFTEMCQGLKFDFKHRHHTGRFSGVESQESNAPKELGER